MSRACVCVRSAHTHTRPVLVTGTLADLDKTNDDDERKCQKLCCGKDVLYSGGCLHTVAVHKGQQHWGEERGTRRLYRACNQQHEQPLHKDTLGKYKQSQSIGKFLRESKSSAYSLP